MDRRALLVAGLALSGCGSSFNPGSPAGGDGGSSADAGVSLPDASGAADSSVDAQSIQDSAASDDAGVLPSGRTFPDTFSSIAILADQLPTMTAAQMHFAASHYVGTQKQLLPATQALRALNKNFLVLHYHLAMWQSAPNVTFIVDGTNWGNDYPIVTKNESWFWHDAQNQRVSSSADGKLLMNVSAGDFDSYWTESLLSQVRAGDYDAVFLDSASPALLQGECSTADPRLAATAARDTKFMELGNVSWITAWQTWIATLASTLAAQGVPLIPNTGAFITGWDNTNYALTPGIFSEGFAGTGFALSDWQTSTDALLALAADKIVILQNYLSAPDDLATRLYYLGNYLLVKGRHTYLDYFASGGPLEWYPEWTIDLGAPTTPATVHVADLLQAGVYRRDFANGSVLVNPSSTPVVVPLGATFQRVVPSGGGPVDVTGTPPGSLSMQPATSVTVAATSAEIVLR